MLITWLKRTPIVNLLRWRKWFRRPSSAAPPRGSEDRPILVKYGEGEPVKYQCRTCQRWLVESLYDTLLRGRYNDEWYTPQCKPCHDEARRCEWERLKGEHQQAWEQYAR